jgi:hypothetical protein
MSDLNHRIDFLESQVPAASRLPDDPRDKRVLKDKWWRRQARWAEASRAMVMLIILYIALGLFGWRIVDRRDADLAATIVRVMPDAHQLADAELRHRLDARAAALRSLEAVLAAEPTKTGWISGLFTASPAPEAIRRGEIGRTVADRLAQQPEADIGPTLDRVFALSHHLGESVTFNALEQFSKLPPETRAALYNNQGEALSRIARTSGSYQQAAMQLQAVDRTIAEERLVLAASRDKLEQQRNLLASEFQRVENDIARITAARGALNACVANVRRSYR